MVELCCGVLRFCCDGDCYLFVGSLFGVLYDRVLRLLFRDGVYDDVIDDVFVIVCF